MHTFNADNFVVVNGRLTFRTIKPMSSFVLVYVKQTQCPACVRFDQVYWNMEIDNLLKDVDLGTCPLESIRQQAQQANAPVTQTPFLFLFYNFNLLAHYTQEMTPEGIVDFVESAKRFASSLSAAGGGGQQQHIAQHQQQFPGAGFSNVSVRPYSAKMTPSSMQQQRDDFSSFYTRQYGGGSERQQQQHESFGPSIAAASALRGPSSGGTGTEGIYVEDKKLWENTAIAVPKGKPWNKDILEPMQQK